MSEQAESWQRWRDELANSADALREDVADACPGEHEPTRHRDGRPAWCRACGRTSDGVQIR